ncbi:hypothetical protein WJX84_002160 [Apatococcus fuscideae]|uniref:Uncharacterized protein n=1 Tax=Apatococcus fuscideae TaxID=2026836 RepID=A0AAW1SM95_9CHLO
MMNCFTTVMVTHAETASVTRFDMLPGGWELDSLLVGRDAMLWVTPARRMDYIDRANGKVLAIGTKWASALRLPALQEGGPAHQDLFKWLPDGQHFAVVLEAKARDYRKQYVVVAVQG